MAKIKSYTDLEQSKKLAEILPLESADMWWNGFVDEEHSVIWDVYPNFLSSDICTPCWSLSALLGVLHNPSLNETFSGWRCDVVFTEKILSSVVLISAVVMALSLMISTGVDRKKMDEETYAALDDNCMTAFFWGLMFFTLGIVLFFINWTFK